jgi:hypothetical protein
MSFVYFSLGALCALTIRRFFSGFMEGLIFEISLKELMPKLFKHLENIKNNLDELEKLKKEIDVKV